MQHLSEYEKFKIKSIAKEDGTLFESDADFKKKQQKIKEMYKSDIKLVKISASKEDVANITQKYDLVVLPVVDELGRLLGRITVDDVVDVILEEAEREIPDAIW